MVSRVAKNPIIIPQGVEVTLNGQEVAVKGSKGHLQHVVHAAITLTKEDNMIHVAPTNEVADPAVALAGTTRALVHNMVHGVSAGFEKKLTLVGVGYRAQAQGKKLNLSVGFSHPVVLDVPEGITIETPSQTEVIVKGADKQAVGQVAANIRATRPPEPYKGKGVRYADEHISLKETKKK